LAVAAVADHRFNGSDDGLIGRAAQHVEKGPGFARDAKISPKIGKVGGTRSQPLRSSPCQILGVALQPQKSSRFEKWSILDRLARQSD
jgi:hypothetical protein